MHYPNLFLSEYIENNPSLGSLIIGNSASYKDWMYVTGFIFTFNGLPHKTKIKPIGRQLLDLRY